MPSTTQTSIGLRTTVGVGDIAVLQGPGAEIITYALGSCLGITIYDPVTHIGGLVHCMLASPTSDEAAQTHPLKFVTTGVPLLFNTAKGLGAERSRLIVCVAGASEILNDGNGFQIGRRNRTILRKMFFKRNIVTNAEDTGGTVARTMSLDLRTGEVRIMIKRKATTLWST